jgi:hypothetical protein
MANSSQFNPLWNYYAKRWDPIFYRQRVNNDDGFYYLQRAREVNAEGDAFSIFWQEYDGIETPWEFDDVAEFCRGTDLENLKQGEQGAGQRLCAWLDDRDFQTSTREYKNPLTASQLYYFLKIPVWNAL